MSPQFKTMKELRTMKLALFLEHFEEWLQYIADQQGDVSEYAKMYFKEIAKIRQDRIVWYANRMVCEDVLQRDRENSPRSDRMRNLIIRWLEAHFPPKLPAHEEITLRLRALRKGAIWTRS